MARFNNLKLLLLGLTISVGTMIKAGDAHAQASESIIVAGGCFWCVESDFEGVKGVKEAVSGFIGGSVDNPTYKQVTKGNTGHYEAVKITYDPSQISAGALYDLFFRSIDPTDAGGQFCDRGQSYATAIFATGAGKSVAEASKAKAQAELGQAIVTPILTPKTFFPADAYHQDYYKSQERVLTRFGVKPKAEAYKRYRKACGRDQRVRQLWGSSAPFAGS